jgi:Uma2 family endonuclease
MESRVSYDDLQARNDDTRWELIDGVAYAMSSPALRHQTILRELMIALQAHFRKGPCKVVPAPFDVKLSNHDVVQPDLIVSCGDRLGEAFHDGPPDLVIEILSPSSLRHDRIRKLGLYAKYGVPEYWLVTPEPFMIEILSFQGSSFVVHSAYSEDDCLLSPRFPDLRVDLAELVARL